MQKIQGHNLNKDEVNKYIDQIYDKYSILCENGIFLHDIERSNIMISKTNVYLIDYEHNFGNKLSKQQLIDKLK
jgi:tRNA A-37 threonylcarbamoyl transferase component Bud32